jgi:hypothetical protein
MVIPVTVLTVGISGTAGAAGGKIECKAVNGNDTGTVTISECTGGNTGGSSEALPASALATGGTIDWTSGSTTTIGAPALTSEKATKCPGYVKPPKGTTPPEPIAEKFIADITGDNGDGMLLPASANGAVCIGTDGTITALGDLTISWHPSSLACTTISGNATSTITVSGCTGGDTGGSSEPLTAATLATGGTIDWTSGGSTTIGTPTLKSSTGKKCPGYVKPAKGTTPAEPIAESFTATVTADTGDGLALPGSAKGAVCVGTDGTITALKPLAAK